MFKKLILVVLISLLVASAAIGCPKSEQPIPPTTAATEEPPTSSPPDPATTPKPLPSGEEIIPLEELGFMVIAAADYYDYYWHLSRPGDREYELYKKRLLAHVVIDKDKSEYEYNCVKESDVFYISGPLIDKSYSSKGSYIEIELGIEMPSERRGISQPYIYLMTSHIPDKNAKKTCSNLERGQIIVIKGEITRFGPGRTPDYPNGWLVCFKNVTLIDY